MKTIADSLKEQKNKLHSIYPFAHLFRVQVTTTDALYLTNHSEEITYNEHDYKPFPINVGDITEDSKGNLPTIQLSVSNINRMMSAYMELYDALCGNEVKIYLINTIDLTAIIDLGTYEVTGASVDQNVATFNLGHYNFFGLNFPRNRFIRGRCRWVYASTECGYTPGITTCNKTFADCLVHANTARFGGFPNIPTGRIRIS